MTYTSWPLFDLRLRTADLRLRPVTEQDLAPLSALLPNDVEQDPRAQTFAVSEPRVRAAVLHQGYWRDLGSWRPEAWVLQLAVLHGGGDLVGVQTLEGEDFPALRTVDSFSWLATHVRGLGLGTQMRRAVLALAFGPLQARAAVTSAWHDNHASLGVSRAVGYRPNGRSPHRRGTGVDEMVHLRLTRDDWLSSAARDQTVIESFEPCRPFFGL